VSEGATGTRARAEASFHPVAGGGVLFDAAQGRLYALNPAAGMTWLCMRDGLSGHQSTLALAKAFEIDRRIAAEWVHISLDRFRDLEESQGSIRMVGSAGRASRRGQRPEPATEISLSADPRRRLWTRMRKLRSDQRLNASFLAGGSRLGAHTYGQKP
jgi:hypothetical protein